MGARLPIEQLMRRVDGAGRLSVLDNKSQRNRWHFHNPVPKGWLTYERTIEILGCTRDGLRHMPIARRPFPGQKGYIYLEADVRAHAETPALRARRLAREIAQQQAPTRA
jgi:hypothetical protein